MAKDPAFLFYSQDFYTGVSTMNFEDRGKYITILCLMHQKGRLTEETIRFIVGSLSDNLKSKFRIDENNFWFNERLEVETEKRNAFTDSRRNNGSLGGRPKKEKPNGKPKRNLKDNHKANLMEDANEDANEIKNEFESADYEILLYPTFDDFWAEYDKKVGDKEKIKTKFDLLDQVTKENIMRHLPLYKQAQPDKQYRKDPATYLNNKSWNDEIIKSQNNGATKRTSAITEQELREIAERNYAKYGGS